MITSLNACRFGRLVLKSMMFALLLTAVCLPAWGDAIAGENKSCNTTDPMIKITSLPIEQNIQELLAAISADVSKDTGLNEGFVTYYWQTFDEIYCPGCEAVKIKKPIFVDIYVPGFMTKDERQQVMISLAAAIERHTSYNRKELFIHTHIADKSQLFIMGDIVTNWSQVGGPDDSEASEGEKEEGASAAQGPRLNQFLFKDPAFAFQSLWRFGLIATGGGDLGEALTAVSRIKDGDHEDWYDSWNSMAGHVESMAREFLRKGNRISAREAFFRSANYYRSAEIYLDPSDPRVVNTWRKGRDVFLEAASLSEGLLEYVDIPYEGDTLPGYFCRVDNSGKKRPLLLIQTGLDATAEDLYFILAVSAVKRGYNCLIFEGPGQGEVIRIKNLPFRYDWEKVVTPVVDFALKQKEVDPSEIAIIGYSMGGYLAPRALAYEHRIKYGIADGGVFSVFDGLMTKFPENIKDMIDDDKAKDKVNEIVTREMSENSDIDKFMVQMLWTFDADNPFDLFRKLKKFNQAESIEKIQSEMLVLNSVDDQVAGSYEQSKIFYNNLKVKKTYKEFSTAEGGQFHCQLGAPVLSAEYILNWLDERMMK